MGSETVKDSLLYTHTHNPSLPPRAKTKPSRRHRALPCALSASLLTPGQCLGQQIQSLAERQSDLFPVTYKTVSWSGFSSDVAARAEPQLLSLGIPLFLPCSSMFLPWPTSDSVSTRMLSDLPGSCLFNHHLLFHLDIHTGSGTSSICRCQRSWPLFALSLFLTLSWAHKVFCPMTLKFESHL